MADRPFIDWKTRGRFIGAAVLSVCFVTANPAGAAPQILGLLATGGPVDLICEDGLCAAEFSSFCLQRERRGPGYLAAYQIASPDRVTLTIASPEGEMISMPAGGRVSVEAVRGYTVVRLSMPAARIAALGGVSASVTVGEHVSLVPVAEAGDPDPLSAAEKTQATGPLRRLADDVFRDSDGMAEAARTIRRMVNTAPPYGRLDERGRDRLWARTMRPDAGLSEAARRQAWQRYAACRRDLAEGRMFGLRDCLEGRLDELMVDLNRRYWDRLTPGS